MWLYIVKKHLFLPSNSLLSSFVWLKSGISRLGLNCFYRPICWLPLTCLSSFARSEHCPQYGTAYSTDKRPASMHSQRSVQRGRFSKCRYGAYGVVRWRAGIPAIVWGKSHVMFDGEFLSLLTLLPPGAIGNCSLNPLITKFRRGCQLHNLHHFV